MKRVIPALLVLVCSGATAQPMVLVEACNLFAKPAKRLECLKVAIAGKFDSLERDASVVLPASVGTKTAVVAATAAAPTGLGSPERGPLTFTGARAVCEATAPGLSRYPGPDGEHAELSNATELVVRWAPSGGVPLFCQVERESRKVSSMTFGDKVVSGDMLKDGPAVSMLMARSLSATVAPPEMVVMRPAWSDLTDTERADALRRYAIDLRHPDEYGVVTDAQSIDQSTPGTSGGAALGAAIGSAAYFDRSFSGGHNYSAMAALGVGLLGAIIGSAVDSGPVSQFQARYTLRLASGELVTRDRMHGDAFRYPVGTCVRTMDVEIAASTLFCGQTADVLRKQWALPSATQTTAAVTASTP